MYSWIRTHTENTLLQAKLLGPPLTREKSREVFKNLEGCQAEMVLLGTVRLNGRHGSKAPNHSQITGPFDNLDECYRPLRKADIPFQKVCRESRCPWASRTLPRLAEHHKHSLMTIDKLGERMCYVYDRQRAYL